VVSNSREYFEFINSISSQQTKKAYKQYLIRFMKFCKLDSVNELLKVDMQNTLRMVVANQLKGLMIICD
jgi:site-specific recombinase XerC